MAGKGVRAGGTMNVCIAVLLCFALLGALDEGSGGRLGVLLFCWMTWGLFVPERSVMPPDVVEEVLVIILKITIIVCGSLVAGRLVLAKCSRWLEWAASRLGELSVYLRMDIWSAREQKTNALF